MVLGGVFHTKFLNLCVEFVVRSLAVGHTVPSMDLTPLTRLPGNEEVLHKILNVSAMSEMSQNCT
jgi:hypothetical protein